MKNTINILVFLFSILSFSFSRSYIQPGSEKPVHSLGVNMGLNGFHIKDQYLSPYIFRGTIVSSALFYQLQYGNDRHSICLSFSSGNINSEIQNRNVDVNFGSIQYNYNHEIDKWKFAGHMLFLYLGTGYSISAEYTKMKAESRETNSYFYDESWYALHSINFHLDMEYLLGNRKSLSISVMSPAIRLVTRPENGHYFSERNSEISENSINMLNGGRLEFIWDDLVLLSEVEFKTALGRMFNAYGKYIFTFIASHRPESLALAMYMNHFLIGMEWLF